MSSLKVIGTGSSGNCYLLDCNGDKLLLDAGVPLTAIKKSINWDIRGIKGVVISHAHR